MDSEEMKEALELAKWIIAVDKTSLASAEKKLERAVEGLEFYINKCVLCGGNGFTSEGSVDQPEQVQCQYCNMARIIVSELEGK